MVGQAQHPAEKRQGVRPQGTLSLVAPFLWASLFLAFCTLRGAAFPPPPLQSHAGIHGNSTYPVTCQSHSPACSQRPGFGNGMVGIRAEVTLLEAGPSFSCVGGPRGSRRSLERPKQSFVPVTHSKAHQGLLVTSLSDFPPVSHPPERLRSVCQEGGLEARGESEESVLSKPILSRSDL